MRGLEELDNFIFAIKRYSHVQSLLHALTKKEFYTRAKVEQYAVPKLAYFTKRLCIILCDCFSLVKSTFSIQNIRIGIGRVEGQCDSTTEDKQSTWCL
jgi:hypothetical protein